MKELGEALRLVLSKVAGFFDIFDLSFFVSGIGSAAAIGTFAHFAGVLQVGMLLSSGVGIVVAAISCYAIGLVSFAVGRLLSDGVAAYIDKEVAFACQTVIADV